MSLTKIFFLLIVGGVVWLSAEYAENRSHPSRLRVPAEAELGVVSGKALGARVVERKSKKGVLASRYAELDVEAPEGVVTVRLGSLYVERALSGLAGETVTAKFDPEDDKTIYSLSTPKRQIIAYHDTAAAKAQLVASNSGGYTAGWVAVALGALGLWIARKRATR